MTLGLSRGMVLTLPFRWIAPRLQARLLDSAHGFRSSRGPSRGLGTASGQQIHSPGRVTAWPRPLPENGCCIVRKLTSTLFLGVRKGEQDEFEAHAWLDCDPVTLTGGHDHAGYSVVSSYPDEQT